MASSVTKLGRLLRSGRKVVCVGKNYEEHITELAHTSPNFNRKTDNKAPMIFLKPTTSYAFGNAPVRIPRGRAEVHYEVELGVLVGKGIGPEDSEALSEAEIMNCVAGYCVAIDMTDRELQTAAKKKGGPWSAAKGFDTFLPVSEPFAPPSASKVGGGDEGEGGARAGADAWQHFELWLAVNGEERQRCRAGHMIHPVPKILRHIASVMTLEPGDLVITGTPSGVGPVKHGDVMTAGITNVPTADMAVPVVSADAVTREAGAAAAAAAAGSGEGGAAAAAARGGGRAE